MDDKKKRAARILARKRDKRKQKGKQALLPVKRGYDRDFRFLTDTGGGGGVGGGRRRRRRRRRTHKRRRRRHKRRRRTRRHRRTRRRR